LHPNAPESRDVASVNTAALGRWDEQAGIPRDAIRSECSTCLKHKEKETGNARE
jgi:hypothetical protein